MKFLPAMPTVRHSATRTADVVTVVSTIDIFLVKHLTFATPCTNHRAPMLEIGNCCSHAKSEA